MDTDWFIKFEEYLHGEMSSEEKTVFEAELTSNEEMNSAFKIYRTIESKMPIYHQGSGQERDLKDTINTLNTRYFIPESKISTPVVPLFSSKIFKSIMAVAASLLIFFVAYTVFFQPNQNPQLLAETYIDNHYTELGQTMGATPDSLELGISAYNNREYKQAIIFFQGVQEKQPENVEATKNLGLAFLMIRDFGNALQQFDELAAMKNLYSNEGLFLKAVTLMQRNQPGDKEEAKSLLEQVVKEEEAGSEQAKEWLKKF
jgi:tetratricopeptide (TPR) repeat protein